MLRKLLLFVRSLFLNSSNSSKERSLTPSLRMLCLGVFLVFVNSVSGQIAQPTAWTKASDQASLTSSTNFAIAAGSNRILIVAITTNYTNSGGSGTQADPTTITYGGVSLTKAIGDGTTSARMHTWLYYLKDNAVMDATSRTLSVTGGAISGSSLANMTIWYAVFSGVNQSPASYTVGNANNNNAGNGPAQLSTVMTVNANEQAIYVSSIYNDTNTTPPNYTINANWASGGSTTGTNGSGGNTISWKNEVAKRNIPSSNITDQATTSGITPSGTIRYSMSAMSLPLAAPPTITSLGSTNGCAGSSITINGTNLTGATAANVKIGGTAVSSITSNSGSQIVAVIGTGTTGTVSVTTAGGTATSASTFTVNQLPTTSNAGPDQYGSSFTLAANAPTNGTGVWSITSGPSTSLSQFSDVNNRAATFTPSAAGSYTLTWTITTSCGSSADDVVVSNCVSNLIKNGDFSNSTGGNNSAANWTYATSKGNYSEVLPENTYFSTSNNDYVAELDAEASLRQTNIPVISGVSYTVTYLYAQRPGAPTPTGLTLKILGGSSTLTDVKSISSSVPQVGTYTFTASSSSIDIEFYNQILTGTQTVGTMIDNIVLLPTSQLVPVATTNPKGTYKTLDFCTGGNGSVTLDVDNISASGVTYSWTGSSGVVFSSTTIKSPTITFTASGLQSATVTATTAGGCSSNSSTTFINVRAPIITTAATPAVVNAVCSSTSLQYTTLPYSSSINSPTTYSIDWATLTDQNSTSFTSSASGGNVTNIAVPAGTAAGTYTGTMTISNGTCTSTKAITLTVNAASTAPTSISGTTTICGGTGTTLTAVGGTLGTGATYQWGTGSVVGTNPISGANSVSYATGNLTGNATYWVRIENTTSPCTATTGGVSQAVTVNAPSTAPTSISGTTTICSGTGTTLTAVGGTLGTGARYQWGTGSVVGTNPISGANSVSYATGNLTGNATYWVRIENTTSPCTATTGGVSQAVTVNAPSTAPTSISGTTTICSGTGTTLTAVGGTLGTGATYQWGTGSVVGTNPISGANSVSYATGNLTGNATYWVRIENTTSPCTATTGGVSQAVTVNAPSTAPTSISGTTTICSGTGTTLTAVGGTLGTGARYQWGTGSVVGTNPISGANSVSYATGNLTGNATYWVRIENTTSPCTASTGGISQAVTVNSPSTAPTSISGTTTICSGTGTTLTAVGGTLGTGARYQWGTGSVVGTNPISGATSSTYTTPTLTGNATYWVRIENTTSPCTATTGGVSQVVTVNSPSTAPTSISGTTTICSGTGTTLTAVGGTLGTGAAYQWGTGSVVGTNPISGATSVSYTTPTLTANATYWVRIENTTSPCTAATAGVSQLVTVNPLPTVSPITGGSASICAGGTTPAFANATAGGSWSITPGTGTANIDASGIVSALTAGTVTVVYTYNNGTCSNTATTSLTIDASAAAPTAGTPTQPLCSTGGASVVLSGLPASGSLYQDNGTSVTTISFSGSSPTISGLLPGTYRFALVNSCTPVYSADVVVQANTYKGPVLGWTYGVPNSNDYVDFASNYDIINDVDYCSVTVSNGATVTVADGKTLTVANGVHVATGSTLTFGNTSNLMQTSTSNTINTGSINYNRVTPAIRKADYVYWSTPVKNQTLLALSPLTRAGLYYTHEGSGWINVSSGSTMVSGKGYIIRGPETYPVTGGLPYPATFIGTPNNGLVTTGVNGGTFCLIGNPYPSALKADKFLTDNQTILEGTIYFWTHNTYAGTGTTTKYTANDYASYNLSGGVDTKPANSMPSAAPPSGNIAAGQGFFAKVTTTGPVIFDNSMRLGGNANGDFYKPGKEAKTTGLERNRVWLNMTNEEGAFKQLLVGYIEGATNSYEGLFDGETFDGNKYLDFYSINENRRLTIQGRALPFEDTDTVPLGYKTTIVGDFTIGIDHADGNLSTQKIYLEDKKTGTVHDLGQSNYTFTTEAGTFADRFVLRYTNKTLGTGDFENIENGILVSVKDKVVKVISSKENLKDITIFDVAGKQLYNKNKVGATELSISNLQSSNQVLLIDITLENGYKTTRKIIFQ